MIDLKTVTARQWRAAAIVAIIISPAVYIMIIDRGSNPSSIDNNNGSAGKYYADRACADFSVIMSGARDRTITDTEIVAKMGKMVTNTDDAATVDSADYGDFNLNAKQMRVAFADGTPELAKSNISSIAATCSR